MNLHEFSVKFLRRMIILHLALKCAISATALLHSSICYRLHETFLLESMKNYSQFDKSFLIQLIFTSMKIIASFVSWRQHSNIRRYFCLQRCVRYCTLSSKRFGVHSMTWCKVSVQETLRYCKLTFSGFYVDFTIHYLLAI